jgi:hypothetical protein
MVTLKGMDYKEIKTQSHTEFRANAESIYMNYDGKMGDGFIELRNQVIQTLYSFGDRDIDIKNALIQRFAYNVRKSIGDQAFYVLSVSLFASSRFKSIYLPFMFADTRTLQDIQGNITNLITEDINIGELEISEDLSVKTKSKDGSMFIQCWRPRSEGGNNIKIGANPIVIVDVTAKTVSIDGIDFNLNLEKSSVVSGEYILGSIEVYGESGFIFKALANN